MQYLKSRPDDTVVQSSFQFITSALNALKNKNPLTETFLVQLDVDTEGMSLDGSQGPVRRDSNLNTRVVSAYASTILYRLDLFTFFFFLLLVSRGLVNQQYQSVPRFLVSLILGPRTKILCVMINLQATPLT